MNPRIEQLTDPSRLPEVEALFREYVASLGMDLSFQHFEQELAEMPGKYAPPRGCILLGMDGVAAVGCVALRPLSDDVCEMKRLYVRPQCRGTGLGRQLVERIIKEATVRGYRTMRLDTIPSVMGGAIALYRALEFVEIPPYCDNPIPGALFMNLRLAAN